MKAWVSRRLQGETRQIKEGDILLLKPEGAPTGGAEVDPFIFVIDWPDDDKEAELLAQQSPANPWPVMVHPYLVTETKHEDDLLGDDIIESGPDDNGFYEVWLYRSGVYVAGPADPAVQAQHATQRANNEPIEVPIADVDVQLRPAPATANRAAVRWWRLLSLLPHLEDIFERDDDCKAIAATLRRG